MILRQLEIHTQNIGDGPLPHTTYKKKKWINDLTLRDKAKKLLEENIRENVHDTEFVYGFSNMTPKTQATKEKLLNWT